MTNKELARHFKLLGDVMELHGENPFKTRSYQNAYLQLRKMDRPLAEVPAAELDHIQGVGKAIASKITELLQTGKMQTLERYLQDTPPGIQELLQVKGLGPKKLRVLWKELEVETPGELLYAVHENRLLELKGFGSKTQEEIKKQLEYFQRSKHLYHYATLEPVAIELLHVLRSALPSSQLELSGAIRRRDNTPGRIDLITDAELSLVLLSQCGLQQVEVQDCGWSAEYGDSIPVKLRTTSTVAFGSEWFRETCAPAFLQAWDAQFPEQSALPHPTEESLFEAVRLPWIAPELRESEWALELAQADKLPLLLENSDVRCILHAHSTYSDGAASLRQMALAVRELGYEYLGISDHSQAAFYANGLKPERVKQQWKEIDALNAELAPFRIYKGIECDILSDGRLDYDEELLAGFDFIIASVHSNLRMDEQKATERLIRAIQHPATRILGHPTGRLLLSRAGYPIDYAAVIDACAEHGVAIELNANPYRLDLDWTWIPYALERGVLIAVNPDAHGIEGIRDVHFGVISARKGGLDATNCLNCLSREEFENWLARKRP